MEKQMAVVTGANRGIGFEICRQLATRGYRVILAARSADKGQAATAALVQEGLDVHFLPLDVADGGSIQAFAKALADQPGSLAILVNNAGILVDAQRQETSVLAAKTETVLETFGTNVLGPLQLIQALLPQMQAQGFGRIVNVSSGMGQLQDMGGGYAAYRLSKVSLNALTRIVAAELQGQDILINSMCPGWVRTDMGGAGASRSIPEGADTAVWLATLPTGGPSGLFFRDRQPISW
jgi:NAD(P)-dependent dehydrogenase (short-subunit alcohol dehydrogenase family)